MSGELNLDAADRRGLEKVGAAIEGAQAMDSLIELVKLVSTVGEGAVVLNTDGRQGLNIRASTEPGVAPARYVVNYQWRQNLIEAFQDLAQDVAREAKSPPMGCPRCEQRKAEGTPLHPEGQIVFEYDVCSACTTVARCPCNGRKGLQVLAPKGETILNTISPHPLDSSHVCQCGFVPVPNEP